MELIKVGEKTYYIKNPTNIGIYKITGNLRLLEILYAAGIGTRRSAGHGKF